MKKLGLVLALLICFVAIDGFCRGNNQTEGLITAQNDFIVSQKDFIVSQKAFIDIQRETISNPGVPDPVEDGLSASVTKLSANVDELATGVNELTASVGNISTGTSEFFFEVNELATGVTGLSDGVEMLTASVGGLSTNVDGLVTAIEAQTWGQTPPPPPPTSPTQLVPLTKELINTITGYGQNLFSLGYYLSATLTLVTNTESTGYVNQAGVFILNESNALKEVIKIRPDEKGRLESYSDRGKEKFEISFPDKTVRLTFERNEKKNSYDLVSADDSGKRYAININEGEPIPQLFIILNHIGDQNPTIKLQSVPTSQFIGPDGRIDDMQRVIEALQFENAQLQQRNLLPTIPVIPPTLPREMANTRNISIEGRGLLERNNIVNYICSQNSTVSRRAVETLIDAYIREAQREGINYDIAVAQMCYATNYYKERQLINAHNYAGFGPVNNVPVRYNTVDQGVRAHIQHLKGYASLVKPQGLIDIRYNVLVANGYLGKVKTLDELFVTWAPTNHQHYGNEIYSILRGLYGY